MPMSSCRLCGAFLWTKENKGDTTRRILNRFQIMTVQCCTHSIISVSDWEVADVVVDNDNGRQASSNRHRSRKANIWHTWFAYRMHGMHRAHSREKRVVFGRRPKSLPKLQKAARNTMDGWISSYTNEPIHSAQSPQRHRTIIIIIRCYWRFYVRMFPLKPSQANNWFGQTIKLSFLESVIIFH